MSARAWPTRPIPGASLVPRANTNSTSGHGSAEADGAVAGSGSAAAHRAAAAAVRIRVMAGAAVMRLILTYPHGAAEILGIHSSPATKSAAVPASPHWA